MATLLFKWVLLKGCQGAGMLLPASTNIKGRINIGEYLVFE
jgi:hypothetical protein